MLNNLSLILQLSKRQKRSEFVVNEEVFLHILSEASLQEGDRFQLDCPYDSPNYRYLNRAYWQGIVIIHLSSRSFAQ